MASLFGARAGANMVMSQSYGFDLRDFRPIIAMANSRSVDGLVVVGYGSQAGNLIRQLRANRFPGRILVPSLLVNADSVVQAAGTSLSGIIFNGFDYQTSNPATARLLDRFRARYHGRQADIGILAYVGAGIVLAHRRPGEPPARTIATLTAAQPFDTILGRVGFVSRSFVYPLRLYEIGPNGTHRFSPPVH
jgi:ABC-type branched-subunit amino acid transport system substrate-binding protein